MKRVKVFLGIAVLVAGCWASGVVEAGTGADEGKIEEQEAWCTASCDRHPKIECEGVVCIGVDRDCDADEPGYVECDGVRYDCPICPECIDGTTKIEWTGECCLIDPMGSWGEEQKIYRCFNQQWVSWLEGCLQSPKCDDLPPP